MPFNPASVPTWMAYKRQLQLLPTFSTASTSFSHYRIPRPAGADPTATDGLICWGSVGNLPNPEPLPTVDFNVKYPDEFWDEKSRTTQDVRIENPDDPTQYIMDRRPASVTFSKTAQAPTSGPNTAAEVPQGISSYENTDSFTQGGGGSQTKKGAGALQHRHGTERDPGALLMSDLPPEGSIANPYRENPPTHFVEVHWKSGAVSWPTAPFSYLECAPATPPLAESYYGTASFWVRVNGALTVNTDAPFFEIIPIVSMMGPSRPDNLYNSFEITISNNTGNERLHATIVNDRVIGDIRVFCQVSSEEAVTIPADTPSDIFNNAWGHILLTWNFLTRTGNIIINKIGVATYPDSFSYHLATSGVITRPAAIAAPVAWQDTPRYFGAQGVIPAGDPEPPAVAAPAEPLATNYLVSLAHVWISTKQIVADVSKFVDIDNMPAPFSAAGELTITPAGPGGIPPAVTVKPDFYFVGGPSATGFLRNTGTTGGTATLIGAPPIAQAVAPKIGA